jgi:hypothetical protein
LPTHKFRFVAPSHQQKREAQIQAKAASVPAAQTREEKWSGMDGSQVFQPARQSIKARALRRQSRNRPEGAAEAAHRHQPSREEDFKPTACALTRIIATSASRTLATTGVAHVDA